MTAPGTSSPVEQVDLDVAEQFMNAHGWLCEEEWGQVLPQDQLVIARHFAAHRLRDADQHRAMREVLEAIESCPAGEDATPRPRCSNWR